MTVGSLFSGIGGFEIGFERVGFEIRWQVEIDAFCRRVLTAHAPKVARVEDVRTCGAHNLERVDVICGGFPCQDISSAGKRLGLAGPRSSLWRQFRRIVRELRPSYVVVENSAALLHPGRGMGEVVGQLAALGYDAEWDCLPVAAFGAPHLRDRVFIVAYTHDLGSERGRVSLQPIGEPTRGDQASAHDDGTVRAVSDADRIGRQQTERALQTRQPDAHGDASPLADVDRDGRERARLSEPRDRKDRAVDVRRRAAVADAAAPRPPRIFGREARAALERWRASDRGRWWDVEPAVVRVVHGVSARVVRRREQHSKQIGVLGNAVCPPIAEFIASRILTAEMTR